MQAFNQPKMTFNRKLELEPLAWPQEGPTLTPEQIQEIAGRASGEIAVARGGVAKVVEGATVESK